MGRFSSLGLWCRGAGTCPGSVCQSVVVGDVADSCAGGHEH